MRLRRFLIEARRMPTSLEKIKDREENRYDEQSADLASEVGKLIRQNCKKFIKESQGKVMWRGVRDSTSWNGWDEKVIRTDRFPKDTPEHIQEQLDDAFENKFGWKARSAGLFCTGSEGTAGGYGSVVSVWPIGDFKFVWAPDIEDLYTHIDQGGIFSSSDMEYEWEQEWSDEYGEGGQGEWTWDGEGTGEQDLDKATWGVVTDNLKPNWENEHEKEIELFYRWDEADDEEKADIEEEFYKEDFRGSIEDYNPDNIDDQLYDDAQNNYSWEWQPEMDFESYIESRREDEENYASERADEAIESYIDKDLAKAIDSRHEIMIGPGRNKYYVVARELTPWVWEYAQGLIGSDDAKQMQFDFVYKSNPKVDKGEYKGNRFFAGVYNIKTDSIEYIITYRDLINKKGWDRKQESEWDDPDRLLFDAERVIKWLPTRVYKRWRDAQSIVFFIPSNMKPPITNEKFKEKVKFLRMHSLASQTATLWDKLKNHIKIKR